MSLLSRTQDSAKSPASPYLAAATFMDASTPPSASSSLHPPSPSSVLSSLSSHSSSSLSKFSSSSISPPSKILDHAGNVCPAKPSFSLLRKRKSSTCKWVSRLFRLHSISMEVDEGLLLHRHSEGVHGSWCDVDEHKVDEKPRMELRFAAKIAAAMDADGFLGVKDSVCAADNTPVGLQQSECEKKLSTLYNGPTPAILPRAPMKQARPRRRRWRFFRRFRRTRVLFAYMVQKVKNVFTSSSRKTLQVRDGFVK